MKKVFASLGVILLVAILGVAVVFAYGSYKDLELKKEEAKVANQKKNDSGNQNKKTNNNENESQEVANQEQTVEENKELDVNAEIAKADKDGDGVATRDEMTPELWELTRQGKFQPTSREIYYQDPNASEKDDEPVTDNEVNNIDDEEERGDVGMDMEQQQRNIDALKESE